MRYDVRKDGIRPTWRVYCDGVEIPKVFAFDTEEGWVDARCLDGHTGREGFVHADPDNPDDACNVRHEGAVEVVDMKTKHSIA